MVLGFVVCWDIGNWHGDLIRGVDMKVGEIKWNKVSDRKPEGGQEVLGSDGESVFPASYDERDGWWKASFSNSFGWFEESCDDVKYWAYKPEAPKGE